MQEAYEWLIALERSVWGYHNLLGSQGSLALAAHVLASKKLRVRSAVQPPPHARELWAAALEICSRTERLDCIPPPERLASECRGAGLPVI